MRAIVAAAAVVLIVAPHAAHAAGVFDNIILSPRVRALGGAYVALADDEMAVFTNPAGLTDQDQVGVYACYADLFGYDFLDLGAASAVIPTRFGTIGVGGRVLAAEYQGVDLERELSFCVGHGVTLMKDVHSSLAVGYAANLYGLSFEAESVAGEDLGSASTVGFDVGVLGTLRGRTRFGFFMKNINNPKLGDPDAEDLPQWFTAGVAYSPYGGVETLLEIQKQDDEDLRACFGIEAAIAEYLTLRGGLQNDPNRLSVGLGTHWEQIRIDYSYTSHAVLPGTHHFGVGYSF
jgi:hypothetical protein